MTCPFAVLEPELFIYFIVFPEMQIILSCLNRIVLRPEEIEHLNDRLVGICRFRIGNVRECWGTWEVNKSIF